MNNSRITLRQLTEMFQSLPDEVLNKKVGYLDLGHITPDELEGLRQSLLKNTDTYIEQCCN